MRNPKNAEACRRLYQARRRLGLCVRCAARAADGASQCKRCADAARQDKRERYRLLASHGLCVACKQDVVVGSVWCWRHAQQRWSRKCVMVTL